MSRLCWTFSRRVLSNSSLTEAQAACCSWMSRTTSEVTSPQVAAISLSSRWLNSASFSLWTRQISAMVSASCRLFLIWSVACSEDLLCPLPAARLGEPASVVARELQLRLRITRLPHVLCELTHLCHRPCREPGNLIGSRHRDHVIPPACASAQGFGLPTGRLELSDPTLE